MNVPKIPKVTVPMCFSPDTDRCVTCNGGPQSVGPPVSVGRGLESGDITTFPAARVRVRRVRRVSSERGRIPQDMGHPEPRGRATHPAVMDVASEAQLGDFNAGIIYSYFE